LLSTIFQLMVAGHDTTASLIGNSVAALLRNPEQLSTLRSDPRKIPAAIEEFLRYDGPVPHSTFRYTVEPLTIAGVTIPKGAQVVIAWRPPTATMRSTPIRSHWISTGP
jgi:cytochrome P450